MKDFNEDGLEIGDEVITPYGTGNNLITAYVADFTRQKVKLSTYKDESRGHTFSRYSYQTILVRKNSEIH